MFHHELDNEHLSDHGGGGASKKASLEMQRAIVEDGENVRRIADSVGGIRTVECRTSDMWEKVRETERLLSSGGPIAISDGALESSYLVVGVSLLVVREDGKWDVYHMSTKGFHNKAHASDASCRAVALKDAGPLLAVLSERYADKVANVWVTGVDGKYNTPYPNPETGSIEYDGESAIYRINMDLGSDDIRNYLRDNDPTPRIESLLAKVGRDPFWVPPACMGSQCNASEKYGNYVCPFKTFCEAELPVSHVRFHLPGADASKCLSNGIETMDDLLEVSYRFPTLEGIPKDNGTDETFTLSDIALRELRDWEYSTRR